MRTFVNHFTFSCLCLCTEKMCAQDWSIDIAPIISSDVETVKWKFNVGHIPTSEIYLVSSQRLLSATRNQRLPIGMYGWGGSLKMNFDSTSVIFDITSDRDSSGSAGFQGLELGSRIKFYTNDDVSIGGNFSFDFDDSHSFIATDITYKSDIWDVSLVGYSKRDRIHGGLFFAQYRPVDWLSFDMGVDYQSSHGGFDKLVGVKFLLEEYNTSVIIDYIHDDAKDILFRGRIRWEF